MAYKIISTVLTDSDASTEGLDAAITLAARMDAHLEIFVVTICHSETNNYFMGAEAMTIERQTRDAMAEREKLDAWVNDRMPGEPVRWALQSATVQGPALTPYLARKLRFCDLVVLAPPLSGQSRCRSLGRVLPFRRRTPRADDPQRL
jgi:hypothetical protein